LKSVVNKLSKAISSWSWARFSEWWWRNKFTSALVEFLTIFTVSNLPFLFLVLIHYISVKGAAVSWDATFGVIIDNWKPGDSLIVVSALLAPFPYLFWTFHRVQRHMSLYLPLFIMLIIMIPASAILFALDRLGQSLNEDFARPLSICLYAIALVLSYFGLVFQRQIDEPPQDKSSARADDIAAQLHAVDP
jgi:hypothetical protein